MFLIALAAAAEPLADAHAASGGLPQFDPSSWPSQLFWLAVLFGGLYALMAFYFLPRLGGVIEERRDRIADDLDQAAESKRKAEDAQKAYKAALADATAKAQAFAADTRARLGEELAAVAAAADKEAQAKVAAAEARIAAMRGDAAKKVREAAIETTRAVVAALIDETPTAEQVAAAMPVREREFA